MPRRSTDAILRTGLLDEHPAVKSWRVLQPGRVAPTSLEVVQETNKSGVYRLLGTGLEGSAVIAKQYRYENALIERTIYEEILPHLPLARLHYYGSVPSDDGRHWLFIEDAGREEYSPRSEEQRLAAAKWLGIMHASAARVAAASQLPDRGPRYYPPRLQSVHAVIRRVLVDVPLDMNDRRILEALVAQCDLLGTGWSRVTQACESVPRTVVHGDFVRKNLRVRNSAAGTVLLPLDWETAGWGLPTVDLVTADFPGLTEDTASPEMNMYRSLVSQFWPQLGGHDLRMLATLGRMLRLIDSVKWACEGLADQGADRVLPRSLAQFRVYQEQLSRAIQALKTGKLKL